MTKRPATREDIDEVLKVIQNFIQHKDERFNQNENKIDTLHGEIIDLKLSHDRLLNTVDTFIGAYRSIRNRTDYAR